MISFCILISALWMYSTPLYDDGVTYDLNLKKEQRHEAWAADFADGRVLTGSELAYYLAFSTDVPIEMSINKHLAIATDQNEVVRLIYYISRDYADEHFTATLYRDKADKIQYIYIEFADRT